MRTQQNDTVIISSGTKGFEVYRVASTGLEMFKGYFTLETAPSADARSAMLANLQASDILAAKQAAERTDMHALWASMSDAALREHFNTQLAR